MAISAMTWDKQAHLAQSPVRALACHVTRKNKNGSGSIEGLRFANKLGCHGSYFVMFPPKTGSNARSENRKLLRFSRTIGPIISLWVMTLLAYWCGSFVEIRLSSFCVVPSVMMFGCTPRSMNHFTLRPDRSRLIAQRRRGSRNKS